MRLRASDVRCTKGIVMLRVKEGEDEGVGLALVVVFWELVTLETKFSG